MYFRINHKIYDEHIKKRLFIKTLVESIQTQLPLKFFFFECLRFYYDENGENQIIPHCEDFTYIAKTGESKVKEIGNKIANIREKLKLLRFLLSIGINIVPCVIIADSEIERFENLNTPENRAKVRRYSHALEELIEIEIPLASRYFISPATYSVGDVIQIYLEAGQMSVTGITRNTFAKMVEDRFARDGEDLELSEKYRTIEEAREFCARSVADNYFFASSIADEVKSGSIAGAFVYVPEKATVERLQFGYQYENIVYS